jgi:hypothetical protein
LARWCGVRIAVGGMKMTFPEPSQRKRLLLVNAQIFTERTSADIHKRTNFAQGEYAKAVRMNDLLQRYDILLKGLCE